jgi:hypothetical protein
MAGARQKSCGILCRPKRNYGWYSRIRRTLSEYPFSVANGQPDMLLNIIPYSIRHPSLICHPSLHHLSNRMLQSGTSIMKLRKGGRSKCGVIHLDGEEGVDGCGWMDGILWG